MKLLVVFALAVTAAAAAEIFRGTPQWDSDWHSYKSKHGKEYNHTVHDSVRRKNWEAARAKINKHNAEAAAGLHSFTMAENHFADLHDDEKVHLTGYFPPKHLVRQYAPFDSINDRALPAAVDLRNATCMPPIENQGQCGSCWSFSASGSLMYALCKKTGKPVRLSEQQLVDCSTVNYGCNGGWFREAWKYVKAAPGQASLTAYPYTAKNSTCKYTKTMSVGTATGYVDVAANETAIQNALATVGAVSGSMKVLSSFQYYSSGVYSDANCPSDGWTTNHAIVIVGYGTLNGVKYWIIRNSWGTTWGQKGYAFIKRGVNMCNIESNIAYPTV